LVLLNKYHAVRRVGYVVAAPKHLESDNAGREGVYCYTRERTFIMDATHVHP